MKPFVTAGTEQQGAWTQVSVLHSSKARVAAIDPLSLDCGDKCVSSLGSTRHACPFEVPLSPQHLICPGDWMRHCPSSSHRFISLLALVITSSASSLPRPTFFLLHHPIHHHHQLQPFDDGPAFLSIKRHLYSLFLFISLLFPSLVDVRYRQHHHHAYLRRSLLGGRRPGYVLQH